MWPAVGILLAAALALVLIDRLALWAEARGWIYWRRRKTHGGAGAVLGPVIDVFQPTYSYTVEDQRSRDIAGHNAEDADPLRRPELR